MPSPQKAKGSGWERDVAKHLSSIYNESFIRAPGSGAYVGGTNNVRKQILHQGQIRAFKGDIVPGPSFSKMNVECKFYADFPFHQLFTGTVNKLEEWIGQLLDAADTGDFNILIMKFNRKGKYIVTQTHSNTQLPQLNLSRHFTYTSPTHGTWHIMDYDTFWLQNHATVKALCN